MAALVMATLAFAASTAVLLLLLLSAQRFSPPHAVHAMPGVARAALPVGFPGCKAEVTRILNGMAAEDAAHGWQRGRPQALQQQLRQLQTAAAHNHSSSGNSTRSSAAGDGEPRALVAVSTADVWAKTQLLLHSLAATSDDFQLMAVDELSDDETPRRLRELGVRVLQPPKRLGVTNNWNMAYREWQRNTSAKALFVINNDVLVPDGVIDAMAAALAPEGGDCDLVGPLSTVAGLGTWGADLGLERLFGLPPEARAFVNNPLNYHRVQAALQAGGCSGGRAVHAMDKMQRNVPGVSGFFFGMRRGIKRFAFRGDELLWDPANRIIHQEGDLFKRAVQEPAAARKPPAKFCLHTGAFVFHYKGSTIDPGVDRTKWQMPKKAGAKKAKPKAQAAKAAPAHTGSRAD